MINVLIVCKELHNLIHISNSVRRGIDTSTCIVTTTKPSEAYAEVRRSLKFDLFIIEVQLDHISGYKLEEFIRQYPIYTDTPILFITRESFNLVGSSHLATFQNYKKRNYISLPFNNTDVQGKIGLYLESILAEQSKYQQSNKRIHVTRSRDKRKTDIRVKDILFLEVQDKVCTINTLDGVYTVNRKSLAGMLKWIDSDDILRCHRYFAANIGLVNTIEKIDRRNWSIHFNQQSRTCPASQTYIDEFTAAYQDYKHRSHK